MILFRRRRVGRHAEDGDVFEQPTPTDVEEDEEVFEEYLEDLSTDEDESEELGPYDSEDEWALETVEASGYRLLDLGSLRLPMVPGVEVRGRVNPQGQMASVLLVAGESQLELMVSAAPRTDGIWDEVRTDLAAAIAKQNGTTEEVQTRRGVELRCTVPGPDGSTRNLRVLGFDGPRWFVQAVFAGRAAVDPEAAGPLQECLDNLVVYRDKAPRPVREPLPLRLPKEAVERAQTQLRNRVQAQAQAQARERAQRSASKPQ